MGKNSLSNYQGCGEKYQLLGVKDNDIIKDRPFCFDTINQFFCTYKISARIDSDAIDTKNSKCGDENFIELVLSIIKDCYKVNK